MPNKKDIEAAELPAPTAAQEDRAVQARQRILTKRCPIEVRIAEGATGAVSPNHADAQGWRMQFLDAFGTRSDDLSLVLLGQLEKVCRQRGQKDLSQLATNAALAIVDGIAPENETEAMLGVQMAGTHALAMEMLGRARHAEHLPPTSDYANLAIRFLRTYTMQMDTLAKLRRKGQQTVRVEHVHVHDGGQAIVGALAAGTLPKSGECHEQS